MSDLKRGVTAGFLNTFSKNLPQGRLDATGRAYQKLRDFVVDRFLPRPEALFTKAMTGGAPTQTEMTPTELAKVKGMYQLKRDVPLLKEEEVFQNLNDAYELNQQFPHYDAEGNPKELTPPTIENAKNIVAKQKKFLESPVVNTYPQGRDMRMAYGNLSVFPQPDGGVRIYDRWKVDKNLMGTDQADRVGDLGEGGPIPSLIYNVAKNLGTYKPFDIDVTVSGDEWRNIEPIYPKRKQGFDLDEIERENQGNILNTLNKLYKKFRPGQESPAALFKQLDKEAGKFTN
ncbi:MAG: hypothetical protein DWQ21_04505 [Bacteroidetes bacterium]|nr:MAG: hypothetical protein DWQ21_04505 [Bacteroidota bacterium]